VTALFGEKTRMVWLSGGRKFWRYILSF